MHKSLQNRMAGRTSRTLTFGAFGFLILCGVIPALAQPDGQELRYLVVWKSRYNDKDYRSEWFYGDPAIADSVANELKQFHAFTGVRVITVPIVLSPDGVSGKIAKNAQVPDNFARRGTGAFTVTDLWNYSVPGAGGGGNIGGGDAQVISLRRADSPSAAGSNATTRPTAPAGGSQSRERLVFDENAPKGQKPGMSSSSQKTLGANERPVKEEILRSKSEVLQSEQQRLDKERSLINQGTSQGGADSKNRIEKYGSDLKNYKQLVGQYQRDLDSHQAKFNPQPVPSQSLSSGSLPPGAQRRRSGAATTGGPYKVSAHSNVYGYNLSLGTFDMKQDAVKKARDFAKTMPDHLKVKILDRKGNKVGW